MNKGKEKKMKKLFEEFKKFIKRGNVVDMAVGVAVAAAFTAIVTAFTKGFITPLLSLITGESDLDEMKWVVKDAVTKTTGEGEDAVVEIIEDEVAIMWGPFVHAIMDFFIIALALFIVIKVVTSLRNRAERIHKKARDLFTDEDEKAAAAAAEAEAKAVAEAEAAAIAEEEKKKAEELRAAEEAAAEAKKIADEKARLERQEQLLTEIRDLLKQK